MRVNYLHLVQFTRVTVPAAPVQRAQPSGALARDDLIALGLARVDLLALQSALFELGDLPGLKRTSSGSAVQLSSSSPLGLDNTTTPTVLESVEEINAAPTSFDPSAPARFEGATRRGDVYRQPGASPARGRRCRQRSNALLNSLAGRLDTVLAGSPSSEASYGLRLGFDNAKYRVSVKPTSGLSATVCLANRTWKAKAGNVSTEGMFVRLEPEAPAAWR